MKQEKYVENIQEILQKRLAYIPRLHVVAVSALDSMEKLAEKYGSSLRLVVGTVEPNIPGVPFITADRVFSREGILEIASIVDDWGMDAGQAITGQEESAGGETISLLAQSLRYIAPHVEQQMAIDCIAGRSLICLSLIASLMLFSRFAATMIKSRRISTSSSSGFIALFSDSYILCHLPYSAVSFCLLHLPPDTGSPFGPQSRDNFLENFTNGSKPYLCGTRRLFERCSGMPPKHARKGLP